MKDKPFPISSKRVRKSPFKSPQKVRETIKKFKKGESIGFTFTSSLKAMGLIPRSNGKYEISQKYQTFK